MNTVSFLTSDYVPAVLHTKFGVCMELWNCYTHSDIEHFGTRTAKAFLFSRLKMQFCVWPGQVSLCYCCYCLPDGLLWWKGGGVWGGTSDSPGAAKNGRAKPNFHPASANIWKIKHSKKFEGKPIVISMVDDLYHTTGNLYFFITIRTPDNYHLCKCS